MATLTYADVVASVRQVNVSLYLPDPILKLGPDPAANEWDMAVAGHPLWLTTDGPDTVTASATHDGLTFTFVAQRAGTTFAIGIPFVNAWYRPERRGFATICRTAFAPTTPAEARST